MIGKLLSKAIKIVTLPVDVIEIVLDKAVGGSGDRHALKESGISLSDLRDKIAEAAEKIDKDS